MEMLIIRPTLFTCIALLGSMLICISGTETATQNIRVPPDTNWCLSCLCEIATGCDRSRKCESDVCGLFQITYGYWVDGGKLTVNNENPTSKYAYNNCTTDEICAGNTVINYMKKYGQDCNNDGAIDCYDYGTIHILGGFGCSSKPLDDLHKEKLETCIKHSEKLGAFNG